VQVAVRTSAMKRWRRRFVVTSCYTKVGIGQGLELRTDVSLSNQETCVLDFILYPVFAGYLTFIFKPAC
jgi:hypothetical protein